ncbi:MAG: ATP-dependent DNA ligase [Candidatus Thorarchaeota archaeon]
MRYERLARAYEEIESTSGALDKIAIFAEVLKEAEAADIDRVIALTMGKLFPDWKGEPEIGIAEKMAVQVVASAASVPEKRVHELLRSLGDIGAAAEELLSESVQATLWADELTVNRVFDTLYQTAKASGQGSSREKVSLLVGLLSEAQPLEAKYILRTVTGSLRLGLGHMGMIDALAIAFTGGRETRGDIERAFNFCSDLGYVARLLAEKGIDAVRNISVEVGRPIRMMAAKKLSDPVEIMQKVGGRALVEYKYDGERLQVHKDGDEIVLFSRRQERITDQYPDVVEYVRKHVRSKRCVIEGECVAIDPGTGEMRPFQELMRRKRKTDIEEMSKEVPVRLFFFDVLYVEDRDVTGQPMLERRSILEKIIDVSRDVRLTTGEVTDSAERLEEIFMAALDTGHEGVIAKAVHEHSTYQAGSRSWLWIKLKASYTEGMSDSVDLVVVGALYGRGKRTGVYGAILAAAYDDETDTFPTVCKIGTGFTDEMLQEFKERLEPFVTETRDKRIISDIEADVWFEPRLVIEVLGDEITISPIHPAGRDKIGEGGLAIRFPRFTGRWRDDKDPTQATTVTELIELFEQQRGER